METEIKTTSIFSEDILIKWDGMRLWTQMGDDEVIYMKHEAIQLRNFLNQLELGEEK